ncbi:MAG: hypothetical protein ACO1OB_31740 [Archangium sp.]
MTRITLALTTLFITACTGTAGDADAGPADAGLQFDAGPQPIKYTQFTSRANGWPSGATLRGAAVLDNVLYAANDQGIYALPAIETTWRRETSPLTGDLVPTSLQRIDQTLVLTAAGATSGGVWSRDVDTAWTRVITAPDLPTWSMVRKSSDYLLVATGGLFASDAFDGTFAQRSDAGVFAQPVRTFVAAPAQQKLFAAVTSLFESTDNGATWNASTLRGAVEGLAASGAYVLVSTATDGQQRSDNYGSTFRPQSAPLTGGVLFYTSQGTTFWAGNSAGLSRSDDLGGTFTEALNGIPANTAVRGLYFAGTYVVADTVDGPYVNQQ